ncbi:G patch domain-containing protein 4 [Zootoca vivipara]|uniref:G patch domain-containing protein 4 n=1 Tax=Zootoca vivipara TaxID=8524 RepID=UPI00293BD74A|nr:G patch domain-containing protein 4 [Zootoca vivipara]
MNDTAQENKSKGLKFAEKQLKKHGWKKGKGLGKRENGISEAIKVKVKCDSAGVGHNPAEQFTFHWWDHLFNSSAANIAVETGQDGVKVKKVSEQDGVITNKKPRKAHGEKNLVYGRFVKAATLTSGGEEPVYVVSSSDSDKEDEDDRLDLSTARRLTDEELVQACGGRTAHKGARHGLTMTAKLARLEEQEKAFLARYVQQKGEKQEATEAALNGSSPQQKKAKKCKEQEGKAAIHESLEVRVGEDPREEQEEEKSNKKKKKKKKRKHREDGESNKGPLLEIAEKWTEMASHRGKPKKKSK